MPRLARLVVPGLPHHITQRGNRRQQTFFCDEDYAAYVELMADWCRERGVAIWAYCFMPNPSGRTARSTRAWPHGLSVYHWFVPPGLYASKHPHAAIRSWAISNTAPPSPSARSTKTSASGPSPFTPERSSSNNPRRSSESPSSPPFPTSGHVQSDVVSVRLLRLLDFPQPFATMACATLGGLLEYRNTHL